MKNLLVFQLLVGSLLAVAVSAMGQGNESVERSQTARSLNGTVVDPIKEPVKDVRIEECSAGFVDCEAVARSDSRGGVRVKSKRAGKVHYLQFTSPGFNVERETVRLSPFAKSLVVSLVVGT